MVHQALDTIAINLSPITVIWSTLHVYEFVLNKYSGTMALNALASLLVAFVVLTKLKVHDFI